MTKQKVDVNKAKGILEKYGNEIKKKYSADAVGIGYKIEEGKLTDKVALVFYVKKKKSKEELLSDGIMPVPEEIEGVPTDVVEIPGGFKSR